MLICSRLEPESHWRGPDGPEETGQLSCVHRLHLVCASVLRHHEAFDSRRGMLPRHDSHVCRGRVCGRSVYCVGPSTFQILTHKIRGRPRRIQLSKRCHTVYLTSRRKTPSCAPRRYRCGVEGTARTPSRCYNSCFPVMQSTGMAVQM
jgi:hypothetical protein